MNVSVTFVFSNPLLQGDLNSFKLAAKELTNDSKSIQVSHQEKEKEFVVVTDFTMKTAAQYKVVDNISRRFKFWTNDIRGYQDMSIQFPKN